MLLCESNTRGEKGGPPSGFSAGEPPATHGYGIAIVQFFVRLVREGIAMRATSRVWALVCKTFGCAADIPHWTTVRWWLQRLGHAALTRPQPQADDWAWLVDHSVQIGQEKCLAILGIRLKDLPPPGECLRHENMQLIGLVPRTSWTCRDVDGEFQKAVPRTGVPRVIVHDGGGDLAGGVSLFQERHPQTAALYDLKHKAACLLKRRLQNHARWHAFLRAAAKTRCAIQQTELSFLVPCAPRPEARFMNLQSLLRWAQRVQAVLADPDRVRDFAKRERLQKKLGWLSGFRKEVQEWSAWQEVVNASVEFVNKQGLFAGAAAKLRRALPAVDTYPSARQLAEELLAFVASESSKARRGERLPCSTEILESCFGKFKVLERDQSRSGFTSFLLAFGALLTPTTKTTIRRALQSSRTAHVTRWCRQTLGPTLFSKRRLAWQIGATKTG